MKGLRRTRLTALVATTAGALLTAGVAAGPVAAQSTTTDFSNGDPIIIPNGAPTVTEGPATPYPSEVNATGNLGNVEAVAVTLHNLSHTFPGDIDVALVAPNGRAMNVMSDTGNGNAANDVTLTLEDGFSPLTSAALTSGTFAPTNIGAGDTYPFPGPANPSDGTFASVFRGIPASGTWSLFVFDDTAIDVGILNGGWTLHLTHPRPLNTVFTQTPKQKSPKAKKTFAFQAGGPAARQGPISFMCSLDGAAPAPCTSPTSVRVRRGKHTFGVQTVNNGAVGPVITDDFKRKKRKK